MRDADLLLGQDIIHVQPMLYYLTGVLVFGVAAQWLAWRARLPAILVLLVFGLIAGQFADPDKILGCGLLFPVVSLSVAVILFEGGLSLRFRELRESAPAVTRLVTVGVMVSWALSTIAARHVLAFNWSVASLLGAILVVTGPTVIVPLLRHVRPERRLGAIAKWEGIVNDPIGAVLAVLVYEASLVGTASEAFWSAAIGLLRAAAVGTGIAAVAAWILIRLLRAYWIPDYLQPAVFLGAVLLTFTISNHIQPEAGLVTVTLLGILLVNQTAVTIKRVIEFKENLRVLLISVLFIVLAARVSLRDVANLGLNGLLFLGTLLLIRPISVFASTWRTGLSVSQRCFLSVMAPRGIVAAAVSSVFAMEIATREGVPRAIRDQVEQLAPLTFLVVLGTVAFYGLASGPLARRLGVAQPNPQGLLFSGASPLAQAIASVVQAEGFDVLLIDTNPRHVAAARMKGLPTRWANILSGYLREEVDLSGLGQLLAMTPNDVVNTLATQEFAESFGRSGVYQLAPAAAEADSREPVAAERLGRVLFNKGVGYGQLADRLADGAIVKATSLSETFDFDAFREHYGPSALVLFIIDTAGRLKVCSVDAPPNPKPGCRLISLVHVPDEPSAPTEHEPAVGALNQPG